MTASFFKCSVEPCEHRCKMVADEMTPLPNVCGHNAEVLGHIENSGDLVG